MSLAGRLALALVIITALANCRVGEAANPGPTGTAQPAACASAKLVDASWRKVISYPEPHRDGFRDIGSPGFGPGRDPPRAAGVEDFAFQVETVNSTGWGPLRRRLRSTTAHAVLAQETWVLQCQVAGASDWAKRHGWESVWAPAKLGPGGGASGGVAIFVKRGMGLRYPVSGSHIVEEARAVAAFAEPPGHRPVLLVSAYLIEGKGTQDANKAILAKIGRCADNQGKGCLVLVGGDFQNKPTDIDRCGFPDMVGGRIAAAASTRGTYRTRNAATSIHFFVVDGRLAETIDDVSLVETSGIKSHVLVQLTFAARAVALKGLMVRQPPELPVDRVYGPTQAPLDWRRPRAAADKALRMAESGASGKQVQAALDEAYSQWCQYAEEEVANATSTEPMKWGLRGRPPKLRWGSILPESAPKGGPSRVAIATWLRGAATEMERIAVVLT